MSHPERPFSPKDQTDAFLEMAHQFNGVNYPHTELGLAAAKAALIVQHTMVMPPYPKARLQYIVAHREPIIEITEQTAISEIEAGNYAAALIAANYLFVFGDIDYQDALGRGIFELSLNIHRDLAQQIYAKFSTIDPDLKSSGPQSLKDIEQLRRQGNLPIELALLRGLIHTTALNGTLGEAAKKQFDPFALISLE